MRRITLNRQDFSELSDDILYQGGYLHFEAHGSSMSPLIRDGDILTVQPADAKALNLGDVAFYQADWGGVIAHRVVGKRTQDSQLVLVIRGDAPSCHDEIVPAEQILGRVMSVQRGDKIIRLDRTLWQLVSILWVRFSSLCPILYRLARRIKRIALG